MGKYVKIVSSNYKNDGYYGLKKGDICLVVGKKGRDIIVFRHGRVITTAIRPFVVIKDDCKVMRVKNIPFITRFKLNFFKIFQNGL